MISIITSTYNCVNYINDCINSVNYQNNIDVEHLIIDGGSTDGTSEIIKNCVKQKNSKISWWLSEKDNGIYNAWNKALDHVKGDWILFLGADDTLFNAICLSEINDVLKKCPENINIVYGTLNIIENNGSYLWSQNWADFKHKFRQGSSLRHTAVFHRTTLFQKHGKFDDSFKIAGDSEFLCRELLSNDAISSNVCIANHFSGGISNNIKSYNKQLKEGLLIRKIYKLPTNVLKRNLVYFKYYIKIVILSIFPNRISAFFIDFGRIIQGKEKYWTRT